MLSVHFLLDELDICIHSDVLQLETTDWKGFLVHGLTFSYLG